MSQNRGTINARKAIVFITLRIYPQLVTKMRYTEQILPVKYYYEGFINKLLSLLKY